MRLTCFTGEENGRWETSIGVVPGRRVSCPAVKFEDETEEAGDHCNASPHPEESLQIGFYHQNVCGNSSFQDLNHFKGFKYLRD